jgi:hypothetical protein
MLNTIIKLLYIYLGMSCLGTLAQDQGERVIGLRDALALAAANSNDTISDVYAADIKSEYCRWIYRHNKLRVLDEKRALCGLLMEKSVLHYELGETDIAGSVLPYIDYLEAESQYADAACDVRISENSLKEILFTGDSLIPESDSLVKYFPVAQEAGNFITDSAGGDYREFRKQREMVQLELLLKKYEDQLTYYEKIMGLSKQLVEVAADRYENEDIEYSAYAGMLGRALDLKLEYLNILNLYNQAAIRKELYLNKIPNNEKY